MKAGQVSVLPVPANPGPRLSTNGSSESQSGKWPVLDERALHGLAGDVVRTIAPETESDPVALLVSFLVAYGSQVGSGPHALADGAPHPARLFGVIVGDTAKARKGTSLAQIRRVLQHADAEFIDRRSCSGLSSGEGLIKKAGEGDKRLFVVEPEFVKVLVVAGRDGNTLSAVMREAWDSGDLNVMTKEETRASGVHISMLGHITLEEAQQSITGLQAANGFANRFLWALARRRKLLPNGGNLDDQLIAELGDEVRARASDARKRGRLRRSSEAEERWRGLYATLAEDTPGGLLGGVVGRGEAQVLRLSVAYALTDGSATITLDHLEAAWALWQYCRQSAGYIFGDRLGDPVAEKVWAIVRQSEGVSRTDLSRGLLRHCNASQMDRALRSLEAKGMIDVVSVATAGRTKVVIIPAKR